MPPIILKIYPNFPDTIIFRWSLIDEYLPGDYKYWFYKGSSPEGPFTQINTLPVLNINEWAYQDQQILTKERLYYYKLKVEYPNNRVLESEGVTLLNNLGEKDCHLVLEMIRKENLRLEKVGVPLLIYKKIHYGTPCDCKDNTTGLLLQDYCLECYGTRYKGGFNTPIETIGEVSVASRTTDIAQQGMGMTDTIEAQLRISGYPLINRDDLVIEKNTNIRWNIWERQLIEWKRVPVAQQCRIERIPNSNIRYKVN